MRQSCFRSERNAGGEGHVVCEVRRRKRLRLAEGTSFSRNSKRTRLDGRRTSAQPFLGAAGTRDAVDAFLLGTTTRQTAGP